MEIRSILCCWWTRFRKQHDRQHDVERALKKIGVSGVSVSHTSLSEASENSADLL